VADIIHFLSQVGPSATLAALRAAIYTALLVLGADYLIWG
jgi:threonine/homoserine/homoserine lactone efflux protein